MGVDRDDAGVQDLRQGRQAARALVDQSAGRSPPGRTAAPQPDLILFALATGLRQGNIKRLTWDRVDLPRRIITVEHGETKNGDALGVPLNDLAVSVLQRRTGEQSSHVSTYRGKPINQVNTKAWKDALKRAGITNFRWHDLRHTWASWLRQNDVPTWGLQKLGGWKSEVMVRRYAHMSV